MSESKEGKEVQRRKVFITILGTSFYDKCNYEQEETGFVSSKTRFIQLATLELLRADQWEKGSNMFLIGLTQKARENNWESKGFKKNYKTQEEEEYIGLKHELEQNYPNLYLEERCDIPDGKNEKEIMEIFSRIFSYLKDGDELYFDLTHGFRYLPMLVLVLGNYTKFVLNDVEIQHMSYGNFELKNDKGNCTFIDLKPLSLLQDWTFAAGQYVESGLVKKLIELSKNNTSFKKALRLYQGKNEGINNLRSFINTLDLFNQELLTCRGIAIYESVQLKKLHNLKDKLDEKTISIFNPIISRIYKDVQEFSPNTNDIQNCYQAAKWCNEKKLYQQAATFLQEYLITFFCIRHNLDIKNKDERKLIMDAKYYVSKTKNDDSDEKEQIDPTLIPILEDKYLQDQVFIDIFGELKDLRNDYNHCGFREKILPPGKITDNLEKLIDKIGEKLLKDSDKADSKIFVNYSNHPSNKWSENQKVAANTYGEIIDIDFPTIPETSNEKDISQLVEEQISLIKSKTKNNLAESTTIHIMGEMTFTYAMVNALKELGYTCVASTTKRIVEDLPDGAKKTTFEFMQFREYK